MKVEKIYALKVKNYTWDDYQALDRYEKLYAFSAKNINDIALIDNLRLSYFDPEDIGRNGLNAEAKQQLKEIGIKFKDAHSLITRNSNIAMGLCRYAKQITCTFEYRRFSSGRMPDQSKIEDTLHGLFFHKDHPIWNRFYPPNHPDDCSKILAYGERKVDKEKLIVDPDFDLGGLKPHPDYDFNVIAYIFEDLDLNLYLDQ